MKRITKLLLLTLLVGTSTTMFAQIVGGEGGQSACSGYWYLTSNAGWGTAEYYKIIDIEAANLTDNSLPKFTNSDGSQNAKDTDFGSGYFTTPVLTSDDGITYTPTSVKWPIKYYMAAFAPTMYTSAYSKYLNGVTPSGNSPSSTAACTINDNSVFKSAIYDKPGFIELSRLGSVTANTPPSRLGYIEIDSIPQCERIQWSYSSTSWKRGVKCDINFNDGNGWIPQRWVASNYGWEAVFAEQGYQFDEVLGKQNDPTSYVSVRFRIWEGDSIHYKVNANDNSLSTSTYSATMTPLATWQTARIHQILIYSGVVPTQAPTIQTAVKQVYADNGIKVYRNGENIELSQQAYAELYSVEGKQLFKGIVSRIDVSGYVRGIYMIKTRNSEGKLMVTKIAL